MAELRPGTKLSSAVSRTQLIVVRKGTRAAEVHCGGAAMVVGAVDAPADAAVGQPDGSDIQLGKRYVDEEIGLELLCTRAGEGPLQVEGRTLILKGAKPLPASD